MWLRLQVRVQSLQLLLFLLAVCHVVVVVQDSLLDLPLWQLLRTAEMLLARLNR